LGGSRQGGFHSDRRKELKHSGPREGQRETANLKKKLLGSKKKTTGDSIEIIRQRKPSRL